MQNLTKVLLNGFGMSPNVTTRYAIQRLFGVLSHTTDTKNDLVSFGAGQNEISLPFCCKCFASPRWAGCMSAILVPSAMRYSTHLTHEVEASIRFLYP